MYKPIIKPPESEPIPKFYELKLDVSKHVASFVTQRPVKYPSFEMFDIDVLDANSISPELVQTPFLSQDLDQFDSNLNTLSNEIDNHELV